MAEDQLTTQTSVVDFVKFIPDGRDPKRADRTAAGYLPGRAMRYCDAITSATGFGYWLFPPMDFQLLWDGEQIFWSFGEAPCWLPLSGTASGAVQFPGFEPQFDEAAPESVAGYSPPFLTALTEPGAVQIWTGLAARTRPGWSLLIRPPANLPPIAGLSGWEGIVETDHWFGPVLGVFRITRTDFPIRIRSHIPFMQVQPIPQLSYREETLGAMTCKPVEEMTEGDWNDLGTVLRPDESAGPLGTYAVQTRRRRACPMHAALVRNIVEGESESNT